MKAKLLVSVLSMTPSGIISLTISSYTRQTGQLPNFLIIQSLKLVKGHMAKAFLICWIHLFTGKKIFGKSVQFCDLHDEYLQIMTPLWSTFHGGEIMNRQFSSWATGCMYKRPRQFSRYSSNNSGVNILILVSTIPRYK